MAPRILREVGALVRGRPDMDAPGTVTGWQPPERFAYEEEWAADTEPTTLATEFLAVGE